MTFRPSQNDPSPSLVRLIREWRPEVILTDSPGSNDADRFRKLVSAAAESAADPHALVDQTLIADLKPWAIDSAAWACERSEPRVWITVPPGEVMTAWGRRLDDVVRSAASLIQQAPTRSSATSYYVKTAVRLPKSTVDRSPDASLQGMRRSVEATSLEEAERMRLVVANQRALQLIRTRLQQVLGEDLRADHERLARGIALWSQVQAIVAELDSQTAGALFWDLARQFRDAGQLSMAHQLLQQISILHARHGLADVARREMIRLQTSDEWRWRFHDVEPLRWPNLGPGTGRPQVQAFSGPTPQGIIAVETMSPLGVPRRGQLSRPPDAALGDALERVADEQDSLPRREDPLIPPADQPVAQVDDAAPVDSVDAARTVPALEIRPQHLLRHLQAVDPVVASDPPIRLALASQLRQENQHDQSRQQFSTVTKTALPRYWRSTAATELWLTRREGPMPAMAASCRAGLRPRLDGQLGDPIWRTANAIHWPLGVVTAAESADASRSVTSFKWARDERFLYLAISCCTNQAPPPGNVTARTRDPDLTGSDRVEISLDVDRDYLSSWRLAVDRQGRVTDACDEVMDWDPQWYVAQDCVRQDHGVRWRWTVEAAMAWNQLVPTLEAGDVWAVQIRRVLPDGNKIAWPPVSAGDQRSARWGLLLME